jgi:hypothetical protein
MRRFLAKRCISIEKESLKGLVYGANSFPALGTWKPVPRGHIYSDIVFRT